MLSAREILFYSVSVCLLVTGYALMAQLFDSKGLRYSVGAPPISPFSVTAIDPAQVGLSCTGSAVQESSAQNVTLAVSPNNVAYCTGTSSLQRVSWTVVQKPEDWPKQPSNHHLLAFRSNTDFYTTSGLNLVTITLGFKSDDDDADHFGEYKSVIASSGVAPLSSTPADENSAILAFQPSPIWTLAEIDMPDVSAGSAGVSLTALVLGSCLLIATVIMHWRSGKVQEDYQNI